MQEKWFLIHNPVSGGGKSAKEWQRIRNILNLHHIPHEHRFTEYAGHAEQLAQEAISRSLSRTSVGSFTRIAVIGGDGTLNEAANGILKQNIIPPKDILLGLIPIGRGNDWARGMKIKRDYISAVERLAAGNSILQDVGIVKWQDQERYFVNMCGIGFDAFVAKKVNIKKARGGKVGHITYLLELFNNLLKYSSTSMTINLDDIEMKDDFFTIAVAILPFNGGGMMQAPGAMADDGLFHITLIRKISKMEVIMEVKNLFDGSFVKHPKVEQLTCRKISLISTPPVPVETDGEFITETPVTIEILPESLRVLV